MAATQKMGATWCVNVVCCAALVVATMGCDKLLRRGKKDAGVTTTTTSPPAPPSTAVKVQATAKTKIATITALETKLPRPTESLKPLDNGRIEGIGGSKPNVAIVWVVPDKLNRYEIMASHFDDSGNTETSCYLAVDKPWFELKPEERTALEVCAGFKYAMFVNVKAYTKPTDNSDNTFTPGSLDTDVLLYNVDTGLPLGGFAARATSSKRFKTKGFELDPAAKDLGMNLQEVIATRFDKLTKTTDFPHPIRPQ